MRRLLFAAVLALLACPALARPALAETPVLAVFEVQDMRVGSAKLANGKLRQLTDLLRNFLAESGAYKVVPQSGLRRAMADAKKQSYRECFDEACQLEIGKAVSANKVVTTKIIRIGNRCIVTSSLFDLRSETTDRAENSKGECAEEALAVTLEKVAAKLKADRAHAELDEQETGEESGEKTPPERWEPGKKKKVIVSFRSDPPGALVQVDGELACQDSSKGCRRALSAGKHVISMQKERYSPKSGEVFVEEGTEIVWALDANFSRLEIRTDPPSLEVRIDGRSAGSTPLQPELEPGEHVVELADACYLPSEQRVTVLRGRAELVELPAVPREGAIDVSAVDATGNAVHAEVFVDGNPVGEAPDLIKVNVCSKTVRVESHEHGAWEGSLAIGEQQTIEIEAQLAVTAETEVPAEKAPPQPRPGIGLRLGAQALLGILCLSADGSSCVERSVGYGGAFALQWPTNTAPLEGGWFFRGGLRAGFLYYTDSTDKPAVIEAPVGVSVETGIAGDSFEYVLGGEAEYAFRKFINLVEPAFDATEEENLAFEARRDASPHAFDLGLYLAMRFWFFEFGGGVYAPLTGVGEKILARIWMGLAYDL